MRYHANAMTATGSSAVRYSPAAVLAEVAAAVAAAAPSAVHGSTLYTGRAGVAYALSRAARADASLLPLAAREAAAAAAAPGLRRRAADSVTDGQAGVACAQLLVARRALFSLGVRFLALVWGFCCRPGRAVCAAFGSGLGSTAGRRAPSPRPPHATTASAAGGGPALDDASPGGPLARFLASCERAGCPGPRESDEVLYGRSGGGRLCLGGARRRASLGWRPQPRRRKRRRRGPAARRPAAASQAAGGAAPRAQP
jgi:hypothetical protein